MCNHTNGENSKTQGILAVVTGLILAAVVAYAMFSTRGSQYPDPTQQGSSGIGSDLQQWMLDVSGTNQNSGDVM